MPYFKLCQIFLNKSIELCAKHYQLSPSSINVIHEFNANGADLSISDQDAHAVECLLMIGSVFQLLSDVLYKRYREDKRFALQTRSATSTAVAAMQLDAVQAAQRLTSHLHAKESALHLNNEQLKAISECYQLVAMPNPSSVLTRHAFMQNGMNTECAEVAQQIRTEILMGKKAKASIENQTDPQSEA